MSILVGVITGVEYGDKEEKQSSLQPNPIEAHLSVMILSNVSVHVCTYDSTAGRPPSYYLPQL